MKMNMYIIKKYPSLMKLVIFLLKWPGVFMKINIEKYPSFCNELLFGSVTEKFNGAEHYREQSFYLDIFNT